MRRLPFFLTLASLAAFTACISDKETEDSWTEGDADTDADADTDVDADADADADSDADADVPHDYKSYNGTEFFFSSSELKDNPGDYDCNISWTGVGTYRDACVDCDFAFDVQMTLDETSFDNTPGGDCSGLMSDFTYGYAYTSDYGGYGAFLMYDFSGTWYPYWPGATFDGTSFTYNNGTAYYYGFKDYPYNGQYYTASYFEGYATLGK